jgi:hypothetical protein
VQETEELWWSEIALFLRILVKELINFSANAESIKKHAKLFVVEDFVSIAIDFLSRKKGKRRKKGQTRDQ